MIFKKINSDDVTVELHNSNAIVMYLASLFNEKIKSIKDSKKFKDYTILNLKINFSGQSNMEERFAMLEDRVNIRAGVVGTFADIFINEFIPMQFSTKSKTIEIKFLYMEDKRQSVIPALFRAYSVNSSGKACHIDVDDEGIKEKIHNLGDITTINDTCRCVFRLDDGSHLITSDFYFRRNYVCIDHSIADYRKYGNCNSFNRVFNDYFSTRPDKIVVETTVDITSMNKDTKFSYYEPSADFDSSVMGLSDNKEIKSYRRRRIDVSREDILFKEVMYTNSVTLDFNTFKIQLNLYNNIIDFKSDKVHLVSFDNPLLYIIADDVKNSINIDKNNTFIDSSLTYEVTKEKLFEEHKGKTIVVAVSIDKNYEILSDIFSVSRTKNNLVILDSGWFIEEGKLGQAYVRLDSLFKELIEETFIFRYKLDKIINENFVNGDVKLLLNNILTKREQKVLRNLGVNTDGF